MPSADAAAAVCSYTGLMWAAVRHKTWAARILLEAGADTETINAWGRNAMFIAAWEQQDDIVAAMIAAGANVSAGAAHDEWTALHKAAEMGNENMVSMLLEAGADPTTRTIPDAQFPNGVTPLSITKSKVVKRVLKRTIAERKQRSEAKLAAARANDAATTDAVLPPEPEAVAAEASAEVDEEGRAKDEL